MPSARSRAQRAPSHRARVRRVHDRARYDREAIDAVLDAALVAHLGFVQEEQPYVIPTLHARVRETARALAGWCADQGMMSG